MTTPALAHGTVTPESRRSRHETCCQEHKSSVIAPALKEKKAPAQRLQKLPIASGQRNQVFSKTQIERAHVGCQGMRSGMRGGYPARWRARRWQWRRQAHPGAFACTRAERPRILLFRLQSFVIQGCVQRGGGGGKREKSLCLRMGRRAAQTRGKPTKKTPLHIATAYEFQETR